MAKDKNKKNTPPPPPPPENIDRTMDIGETGIHKTNVSSAKESGKDKGDD